jgi:hypothetical protein
MAMTTWEVLSLHEKAKENAHTIIPYAVNIQKARTCRCCHCIHSVGSVEIMNVRISFLFLFYLSSDERRGRKIRSVGQRDSPFLFDQIR